MGLATRFVRYAKLLAAKMSVPVYVEANPLARDLFAREGFEVRRYVAPRAELGGLDFWAMVYSPGEVEGWEDFKG